VKIGSCGGSRGFSCVWEGTRTTLPGAFDLEGKMEIRFDNVEELVDGVMDSGISVRDFAAELLKRFDCAMTKSVARRMAEWDEERADGMARMATWDRGYSLVDIPEYIAFAIKINAEKTVYEAADIVVQYTNKSSDIRKCFVYHKKTISFNERGYIFLIGQFRRRGWISSKEHNEWKRRTGLVPIFDEE
jgi:hypothetical protein